MGDPVTIWFREDDRNPGHTRVSVFVGRYVGARGHSGVLTLRTDEWDEIVGKLRDGDPCDLLDLEPGTP